MIYDRMRVSNLHGDKKKIVTHFEIAVCLKPNYDRSRNNLRNKLHQNWWLFRSKKTSQREIILRQLQKYRSARDPSHRIPSLRHRKSLKPPQHGSVDWTSTTSSPWVTYGVQQCFAASRPRIMCLLDMHHNHLSMTQRYLKCCATLTRIPWQ